CSAGIARHDSAQSASEQRTSDGARPAPVVVPPPDQTAEEAQPNEQALVPVTTGASWPTFHGDARRHGATAAPAIDHPRMRWAARVGIQGWLNSPLVMGKTVLVPSSGKLHNAPDPEDGLHALDLRTGKRIWFTPTGDDANGAAAD